MSLLLLLKNKKTWKGHTPVFGSNIVVDPTFSDASKWTTSVTDISVGGGYANFNNVASSNWVRQYYSLSNWWIKGNFTVKNYTSGKVRLLFADNNSSSVSAIGTYIQSGRNISGFPCMIQNSITNTTLTVDDVHVYPAIIPSLFFAHKVSNKRAIAIRLAFSMQAGIVLNLDSIINPQNFIIAYINNGQLLIEKCVAGTYTKLAQTAINYVDGGVLLGAQVGNTYTFTYNGVQVGSAITDSTTGSNSLTALFTTDVANKFFY